MSALFDETHRTLQDQFETRKVADKIEALAFHGEVSEEDKAFIESRDMFWLSTVTADGNPTVSYKGGDPGFVKVVDDKTIAFPSYDGNGMFFSVGNIVSSKRIGMLFMDLERPFRLRLQGEATVSDDDPLMEVFKEAQLIVRVSINQLFPNCPRYVHRYQKVQASKYVPRTGEETPFAGWKRIDLVQEDLPNRDKGGAEKAGGTIPIEQWFAMVGQGDQDA